MFTLAIIYNAKSMSISSVATFTFERHVLDPSDSVILAEVEGGNFCIVNIL